VVISVIDTGSGITEKQHGHLFEKFYKADSFQQGLGLGLSISKMIAQKLGGELTCDENYTEGARFVLTLPTE
jgi:signal transduction histidine kinase